MKRLIDIMISGFGLLLLSPLLVIISLLVFINDLGPVCYKAPRIGLNGVEFRMFKFRSMIVDADKKGASSTTSSDVRITKIGHFLRRTKLDELPQLINVFKGNMSIVGPRPEVKFFTDMFTEEESEILNVKPGITDFASIWNSNEGKILEGYEDADKAYMELIWPEKKRLQLKYVKEQSFLTDIKIMYLTLRKVIWDK